MQSKGTLVTITCSVAVFTIIVILATTNNIFIENGGKRMKRSQPETDCENDGEWNEKSKICVCTLGWIGNRCNVWHDHRCFFDNGENYRGKLSVTKSGEACLPWTTDGNKRFALGSNGIGVHNYCRNPDNDDEGPWCYVGGANFTGYCNTTRCPDSLKELLSRNTSDVGRADDTSAAVQFLFGPLISGVCAGVVVLLAFIAIAEYARRKNLFSKWRKSKSKNVENEIEKGEKDPGYEKGKDGKNSGKDEKTEVKPLGGIVTVDVDTGKEKVHTYQTKDMKKKGSKLHLLEQGSVNDAFIPQSPEEGINISEKGVSATSRTPDDVPEMEATKEFGAELTAAPSAQDTIGKTEDEKKYTETTRREISHRRRHRRRRRSHQRRSEHRSTSESDSRQHVIEDKKRSSSRNRRSKSRSRKPLHEEMYHKNEETGEYSTGTNPRLNDNPNELNIRKGVGQDIPHANIPRVRNSNQRTINNTATFDQKDEISSTRGAGKTRKPRLSPSGTHDHNDGGHRKTRHRRHSISKEQHESSSHPSGKTKKRNKSHHTSENAGRRDINSVPPLVNDASTLAETMEANEGRRKETNRRRSKNSKRSLVAEDSVLGKVNDDFPTKQRPGLHMNTPHEKMNSRQVRPRKSRFLDSPISDESGDDGLQKTTPMTRRNSRDEPTTFL